MSGESRPQGQQPERGGWARWTVWVAGLVVALGAGVVTAHGLYEVAVGAGVPLAVAWLYPIITDGLALVAYGTTARLADRGQGYAWAVVVVAAGISGMAQAAYLAGGVAVAPPALKFLIGAWPAVAAAIVAHLLFLLGTDARPGSQRQTAAVETLAAQPVVQAAVQQVAPSNGTRPTVHSSVQLDTPPVPVGPQPVSGVQPVQRPAVPGRPAAPKASPSPAPGTARERALTAARHHSARHGSLPTVNALADLADVSRGTAAAALKDLRAQPQTLRVVETNFEPRTHR